MNLQQSIMKKSLGINLMKELKKKNHVMKVHNKGRKILGKSLQGHSPIYE